MIEAPWSEPLGALVRSLSQEEALASATTIVGRWGYMRSWKGRLPRPQPSRISGVT